MRYYINFDKTINQLVPHYLGGRRLILYLQALLSPLRKINDAFVNYTKETRIEASMTSQKYPFEWYLNRKFEWYFANGGKIVIQNSEVLGTPIYHQLANVSDNEDIIVFKEKLETPSRQLILYHSDEQTNESSVSFVVSSPRIYTQLISEQQYIAMLRYTIDKYRLANKTYIIKYES